MQTTAAIEADSAADNIGMGCSHIAVVTTCVIPNHIATSVMLIADSDSVKFL